MTTSRILAVFGLVCVALCVADASAATPPPKPTKAQLKAELNNMATNITKRYPQYAKYAKDINRYIGLALNSKYDFSALADATILLPSDTEAQALAKKLPAKSSNIPTIYNITAYHILPRKLTVPQLSSLKKSQPLATQLKQAIYKVSPQNGNSVSFAKGPNAPAAAWTTIQVARLYAGPYFIAHGVDKAAAAAEAEAQAGESAEGEGKGKQQRRVVVTGMGIVSCLSMNAHEFYQKLLDGTSGISAIEGFDASEFPTRIAGEIKDFKDKGYVHPKMARRMDKYMRYLLTAGKRALRDAHMSKEVQEGFNKQKCGVLIGSAMGGMQVFNDAVEALKVSYRRMNPFCIPFVTTNMGSAMLAMDLGWMGPNYSISTACATANYCILAAAQHIQRGDADVMLSGGSDAPVLPLGLGGFVACKALSKRNDEPERASRPWDKNRDGFVMGEGAGVLVLEELEHAKARGATIYAEFLGGSVSCDAHHMTDPHPQGKGVLMCIEQALASSGVPREYVNYVNAHATSTLAGDVQEYKALVAAFGNNPVLKMNATKSMIGHLLGAAGGVEAIATVGAIHTGYLHPNLNLENLEDGLDERYFVRDTKERLDVNVGLSNSFGFGGHNSSILFAPYHPEGIHALVAERNAQA
ncbi:unnamed protein product [Closterium sp. Naga37s-1]|nr:unnamed protein product [Closterium sp. Naga37s-1]